MATLYETYAGYPCSEVPREYLENFITGFLYDASKDMGVTFEKSIVERVVEIISQHYAHLPLALVSSACKKGALGQYGAGRLVPRTVYGWMAEMSQYYLTIMDKKDRDFKNEERFKGLDRYPLGKAICWKIDHVKEEDWERVPVKTVAEIIGRGSIPTLENFGIKYE
jgi:hypothetical protein